MPQLIATVILIGSFLGIVVILARKIPILENLPPQEVEISLFSKSKGKIKNRNLLKSLSFEKLLQKSIYGLKNLILKAESQTNNWVEKSNQKNYFQEDYWEKLKKINKSKRGRRKRI